MMDASAGHLVQLAIAVLGSLVLFVAAYGLNPRVSLTLLVLLLPFQLITSRYGAMNVMMIYIVAAAFLLRGRFQSWPLFGFFALVLFAYIVSMSMSLRPTWFDHATYIIAFVANVLIFYLLYNFVVKEKAYTTLWKINVALNVLVLLYCGIQMIGGGLSFLGVSELQMLENREDGRLVGPFSATAITAEYLVIQILFLSYYFFLNRQATSRWPYVLLLLGNCFFLVTTGNRGGLVALVLGMLGFVMVFRKHIGIGQSMKSLLLISVAFVVMGVVAVRYTDFNVLFERLQNTQVEGVIPDTREIVWPYAWDRFKERPAVGHGPRLRLIDEENRRIKGHSFMAYPHSAPLYILYTIGIFGFTAYLLLGVGAAARIRKAIKNPASDMLYHNLPRLTMLILAIIFISQMRMEMFRFNLFDYQSYLFALFGALIGIADNLRQSELVANRASASPPLQRSFHPARKLAEEDTHATPTATP